MATTVTSVVTCGVGAGVVGGGGGALAGVAPGETARIHVTPLLPGRIACTCEYGPSSKANGLPPEGTRYRRPGLSVPASLGAYLTWAPRPGITTDADRNCVSNIQPDGLAPDEAARRIAWLLTAARDAGQTGVALKDASEGPVLLGP